MTDQDRQQPESFEELLLRLTAHAFADGEADSVLVPVGLMLSEYADVLRSGEHVIGVGEGFGTARLVDHADGSEYLEIGVDMGDVGARFGSAVLQGPESITIGEIGKGCTRGTQVIRVGLPRDVDRSRLLLYLGVASESVRDDVARPSFKIRLEDRAPAYALAAGMAEVDLAEVPIEIEGVGRVMLKPHGQQWLEAVLPSTRADMHTGVVEVDSPHGAERLRFVIRGRLIQIERPRNGELPEGTVLRLTLA